MKLLYINDELGTSDGSNSHAVGMYRAFEELLGKENVCAYPEPQDGSKKPVNIGASKWKARFKGSLTFIRCFRKKYLSVKRSRVIVRDLKEKNFIPTHVLARSTDYDVTAIYVAKTLGAKLIYEVNTPLFYEKGVIKQEPMTKQLEKWEKKILLASDKVYVVSQVCRDMLCEHYGCDPKKFLVVPNGYMRDLYCENSIEKKQIRNRIREDENITDRFVVTFVGSLKMWHGIQKFCDAAKSLETNKNIVFLVLGDGEMHDLIVDYTKEHNNLIFKGKVDLETMKKYLYASDLGIMPYEKKDNFYYSPLKMYDMLGAGIPFVGTAVGQIEDFAIENGIPEILISGNETDIIASAIMRCMTDSDWSTHVSRVLKQPRKIATWESRTELLINGIK